MKPLQNIYLSLGSNQGHKFEHLQQAIHAIYENVGAIVKISPVYKTPAMGFDGDDFLNCVVLVQSMLSPAKVLETILSIELKMGRERKQTGKYTSRPIDIDILLIDDLVKKNTKLTVPHPEMQNRKFVLQPLADIAAEVAHPVFRKKIIKLLAATKDESKLEKQSKWLVNPKSDYDISTFNYIAIEGNIGAGKTSLATQMATDFNAKLILERFKDNPFLPKFYKDQQRYAFPLEMSFLADRYQQLLEDIKQFDLFKECVIADYDAYKSLIFAKVTLAEEEYALYKKLFHLMHKELPKPDVYIYLYQNTERLLENIKKRGRTYEQSIQADYLKKINEGYLEFIKNQHDERIKIIDISALDFVKNRKDYLTILRQIVG
ncbi:2-amino-4-hydroxy-6-hydroxymethyldihydropteridine diphosphokinase [Marixanthomonas spongiae]|uniref:2-amino-4-hydroxy-6-hydroxymethyldihydropteridine pyrophosphokinase n=1 Tax=Marixanthomonas spongiae TaxID=2174845 RepID=A0A2U0I7Z3_9FLAO|nr:2-amino-4-hydroxy-6-hydroxymethyldihydropteridine diphosphokinase [Marixanthomonas spongiae]PVW17225.1 2-amino-4-hydroxy-6-hydroxymethyldihydropteridine diphosphokinase [Marixanthomonas spongiae]